MGVVDTSESSRLPTFTLKRVLRDATNGAVGAGLATALLYPFLVAKVRLQAQSKRGAKDNTHGSHGDRHEIKYSGFLDCISKTFSNEGIAGLYVGLGTTIAKQTINNFVFYFFHSALRRLYFTEKGGLYSTILSVLHGMNAGVFTQVIILPMDMIVMRVQTAPRGDPQRSFFNVVSRIYEEGGLRHFWAGLAPGLTLTLNPGITIATQKMLTPAAVLTACTCALSCPMCYDDCCSEDALF
eukprot:m.182391 g.182391  ORF g.182391 m.182391 type:complete len:240 (+) comp18461_c0_seq1:1468-2187(+)